MVSFYLSSKNTLHIAIFQFAICVFAAQTLVFAPNTKIVRLCPSIEYILKFQKWWTIPKITLFLPLKWWLIPNIHTKTYIKWWQHTKYRIQSHHQICPSHTYTYCPYHTNKSLTLSVLHAHYFSLCSTGTKSIYNS